MQIKNSFDKDTWKKIGRGCLYAISGFAGAALPILVFSLPQETWWGAGCAWLFPVIGNTIKEYVSGKEQPLTLIREHDKTVR